MSRSTRLSLRELEVLRLAANGYTNREIAEALFLTCETVKSHKKSILHKTDAANTAHAVHLAWSSGLLTGSEAVGLTMRSQRP